MIEIRPAAASDAAAIAGIYAPYVATNAVSFESEAPGAREMKARMAASKGQLPWLVLADEETNVVLAYAFAKPFREAAPYRFAVETALYAAGGLEGQGHRRTLYNALLATLTAQGYTQAIATLATPNDKLILLHESVGFRRAGAYREVIYKNGQWYDVGLWQRELDMPSDPPEEPKPFSKVGVVRS